VVRTGQKARSHETDNSDREYYKTRPKERAERTAKSAIEGHVFRDD
jgi:hypothetical protein